MRICCRFLSFCSNRNARLIIGPIVKPRSPYASYFRLKAQIVRLISCANERSFPVLLRPLSLQMRPVFVEKSIKMNCKFLILPSSIDRHDNQVGRWLTNFRATWDPKFDSYAVVGSMKQPRQVRLSEVCGFSIVWSLHVKSNVNG